MKKWRTEYNHANRPDLVCPRPRTDEAKRKLLARLLAEQEEPLASANQKHDAQLKAR
jgi:hypothetical protein